MSKKNLFKVGISAALNVDLSSNEIQLTPDGEFSARDGRPHSCKCWVMNAANAQQVIAKLSQRKSKIVIDFEHHTLKTDKGVKAEAAGWFYGKNVVYRPGLGLFATHVEWVADTAQLINAKKYLYISPIVIYNARTGDIFDIYNAALTNDPAIDGMNEIEVAAASNILIQQLTNNYGDNTMPEEILALLRKILGLGEDATEADILAALQQIDQQVAADAASNLTALLANQSQNIATLTSQLSAQQTAVAALKAKQVDPTKYVPVSAVTQLTQEIAELKTQINGDKVTTLVNDALTNGKLFPALKDWAKDLGNKNIAALTAYLDKAPTIDALSGNQTGGKPPENNEHGLTADELQAAELANLSPAEYAQAKKEFK